MPDSSVLETLENFAPDEVDPLRLAALAVDAADRNMRWKSFYLCACLINLHRGTSLVQDTICQVVKTPDDLTDLLIAYAKVRDTTPDNLRPIMTHGLRKGLAKAIHKFYGGDLIKAIKPGPVKLRDVVALAHVKPSKNITKKHLEVIMKTRVSSTYSSSENVYILPIKR